jgi:hypothetical protein
MAKSSPKSPDEMPASLERNEHIHNNLRDNAVALGSATVPVALVGVSPASWTMILPTPLAEGPKDGKVVGETPKTAVEKSEQHTSGPLKRAARAPQSNCIVPA